ncbi:MAG: fibronectin type III-like domain-contianing protein [Melioribacteraceae bacterium]|nr:fibronectin type III-like domain-contianing protein [Melioribacteraceae bacterium]MCF8356938.1 fibronectin type III-like domain-contianing protein [Melioribacteraceae bacterium]MCF8396355.1 fibronectin type III-like domain-contianing protein [Melioribacteraceae bacterium]MCF8421201.1 fibronectin type III-like domain-contianing protein [Melioribacteraceae bacterium]
MGTDGNLTVTVDVTNSGDYDTAEVLQLYIRDFFGSGETKTVTFTLTPGDLEFYNDQNLPVVEPGDFHIWVGPNSAEGLKAEFSVE